MSVLDNEFTVRIEGLALGLVAAKGASNGPSPAALGELIAQSIRAAKSPDEERTRTGPVRDLLRHGKYKPTGRGKPASEYLLGAAREGRFPSVGALVDALNLVSLESLLPISLIDVDRAKTRSFAVRRGKPGETYVFNASGQILDVEDLLCVAVLPEDLAVATPVKDSMATKLVETSSDVVAVVWAPTSARAELSRAVARLEALFREQCQAQAVATLLSGA